VSQQSSDDLESSTNGVVPAAVILFIFALTEGSAGVWISVKVLLPLVLAIFLMVGFFVWERIIPAHIAAMYVFTYETRLGRGH
jgi:hypothetical protein